MSQVANPEAFGNISRPYCGYPDTAPEVAVAQRSPSRRVEVRAAVAAVAAAIDLCKLARGWIVERSGERSLAGHYLAKKCRVDASTANDTN